MIKEIKHCKICGRLFKPRNARGKYCSDKCRQKADAQRKQRERKKLKAGKQTQKRCKQCRKFFKPINTRQEYCSKDCKQIARNIRRMRERDLDQLREDIRKHRDKQVRYVTVPLEELGEIPGAMPFFDEDSIRGVSKNVGTIDSIPKPPKSDADEEEWKKYHKRLEKELKKIKKTK